MAAFQNLPWLDIGPDVFMRAMNAGAQAGLRARDLSQDASAKSAQLEQSNRPRGAVMLPSGIDPYHQALTERIRADMAGKAAEAAGVEQAWSAFKQLTGQNVSQQDAFNQAGLGQFGVKAPEAAPSPWTLFGGPGGGITAVDKNTLAPKTIVPNQLSPGAEQKFAVPTGVNIMGDPTGNVNLTGSQLLFSAGDNKLPASMTNSGPWKVALDVARQKSGQTNAPTTTEQAPAAPRGEAMGGYRVGGVYGGLKYLGGDPNSEQNWEKVR